MSTFRRCSRPGCGRPAVATLSYAHAESTAFIGPLAPTSSPHAWDLCEKHAASVSVPVGWQLVTVEEDDFFDDEDLTALAEAVREAGRNTSGLQINPSTQGDEEAQYKDGGGRHRREGHPALRKRADSADPTTRRAHLHVVRDSE